MNDQTPAAGSADDATVIADTRRWLERAVIGLNLCPFAKSVYVKEQVHYAIHGGDDLDALMERVLAEARELAALPAAQRDTTLLMLPGALADFFDFNDFTARAQRRLARAGFEGELQLANFHPRFQFEGTAPDDIGNATNWAPYPTFHLIREASIDRAVQAYPEAEAIFERNIALLEEMGPAGWAALDVGPHGGPKKDAP